MENELTEAEAFSTCSAPGEVFFAMALGQPQRYFSTSQDAELAAEVMDGEAFDFFDGTTV